MINDIKMIGSIDRIIQLQNELKQIQNTKYYDPIKSDIFKKIYLLKLEEIEFQQKLILGNPKTRLNFRIDEANNIRNLLQDKSWQSNDSFTKEMIEKYQYTLQNYLIAIEEDKKLLVSYNKPKHHNLSQIMMFSALLIIFLLTILIL